MYPLICPLCTLGAGSRRSSAALLRQQGAPKYQQLHTGQGRQGGYSTFPFVHPTTTPAARKKQGVGLVPEGLGGGAYSLGRGFLCSPVLLPWGALGEGLCLPRTGRPSQHLLFSRFYSGVAQGALHASHTTNWNGGEGEGPQSVSSCSSGQIPPPPTGFGPESRVSPTCWDVCSQAWEPRWSP